MTDLHEQFFRGHQKVQHANNRRFGLVVGGIVFLIGAVRVYFLGEIGGLDATLGLIGLALMVGALLAPDALQPLNRAWAGLGLVLHKVINPVVLAAMFILAILPTGLIMRALRVDPMARRLGRNEDYWRRRTKPASTAESLKQPF
jgi:hypothetical protein